MSLEREVEYLHIFNDALVLAGGVGDLGTVTVKAGTVYQVDRLEVHNKYNAAGSERVEIYLVDADNQVYAQALVNGIASIVNDDKAGRGVGRSIGPFDADKVLTLKARGGSPATNTIGGCARLRRRHPKPSSVDATYVKN
jgi:hypothetical protein